MLRAELKAVGGRHDGKLIPLEVDRKFLIGREQDCHLRPNSESVSRHHCCFTLDAFCLRLRDLGSTNGTLVNGDAITGQVQLKLGDRVTVGPLEFEVLIDETDDAISDDESEAAESDETVEQAAADSVLDDSTEEPTSGETMIDLPTDMSEIVDSAASTAILSGDTTVIPNDQQQQLQQQLAMQQQMAMQQQQQQQQQQLAMQQQMAMQQQLAMQQQMPYVAQPGMMPGMMPPGFAPAMPPAPAGMPAAEQPVAEPPANPLDVTLPDPATTGAKDPEPVEKSESEDGEQASGPDDNPSNVAEDIIKQYMHRRPSTGS
jgi:predicted component of type VI protein secretion system